MNRICWAVEKETSDLKFLIAPEYTCYNLQIHSYYNHEIYNIIKLICDNYRSAIKKESKNILTQNENSSEFIQNTQEVLEYYIKEMRIQCPNEEILCDILIDLCYNEAIKDKYSKDILWTACGNVIVNRAIANCLDFKKITSITKMVFQRPGGFESTLYSYFYQAARTNEIKLARRSIKGERFSPATRALWFYATKTKGCKAQWYNQWNSGKYKNHCFYSPLQSSNCY